MQLWPLLTSRASAAAFAAASRSASASTMNGSQPPSSSTVFLSARPACAATALPARSLPVSVTATMRGSAISAATGRELDQGCGEEALREARVAEDRLDRQRAPRHVRGVLEDAGVAGHQRRRGEAEHLPEGEVPRHDREHDAERIEADVARRASVSRGCVGEEALRVLGVVVAGPGALLDLGLGLDDRLAHLEGHGDGVGGQVFSQEARDLAHAVGPGRKRHRPPLDEGGVRARHDALEVLGRGRRERLEGLAGSGIHRLDAHRILPPARRC